MNESAPLVSVIVATLDQRAMLADWLDAISAQDYPDVEVIVVDNGSTEDIEGLVRARYPSARVVRLETNAGFAGGYNRGIEASSGRYAAVINNDAIASPGWITAMVEAAEADEKIGAVASVIIDGNNPAVLDSCGVGVALDAMSRQAMRGAPVESCGVTDKALVASGCACMYRRAALDETGLFDEDFFAYCEDTDLGLRLVRAGWRTAIATDARVTHYYSMTTGKSSLRKLFWVERNHFWVAAKNFPLGLFALVPFVTTWRFAVQAYLVLAGRGGLREFASEDGFGAVAWTILRAHISALGGLPRMFAKRAGQVVRKGGREMAGMLVKRRMSIMEVLTGPKNARD